MFWQKDIETMKRTDIEALQLERLRWVTQYAYNNVRMYHDRFDKLNIKPEKIKSLKDIENFPFTTKDDFKDNYPYGMFAVPKKDVVRIHGSSGTTGKPILGCYTSKDLDIWSTLIARLATAVGVTADDVAQIAFGYGLFTGGFGLHYGLEKVGCMVVPLSSGNTERQLYFMEDLGTTVLIATPSYALYLSEAIREAGIRDRLKIRVGLFGGEGCTAQMREQIEHNMGIIATDNYGLCEIGGPGVSGECIERNGLHIAEDHYLAEIIDSDTLMAKDRGETGELVMTTLTREGMPVIRYRTKDISRINYDTCRCGRTMARMDKITGRADDMLIIKGVNVFPSQIESVIVGIEGLGPHYQLIVRHEGGRDALEVQVELENAEILDNYGDLKRIETKVFDKLISVLGLRAKVTLVEPKTIERFQGKAKRVIDLRNEKPL